jgi:hypothetical protein
MELPKAESWWWSIAESTASLFDAAIAELKNERHQSILRCRLGLKEEFQTLAAIADDFGVSKQRIAQLQKHAVVRLQVGRGAASVALRFVLRVLLSTGFKAPRTDAPTSVYQLENHLFGGKHKPIFLDLCGSIIAFSSDQKAVIESDVRKIYAKEREQLKKESLDLYRLGRVKREIEHVIWPTQVKKTSLPFSRAREVNDENNVGVLESKINNRLIHFESGLEMVFYEMLEKGHELISCYQEQPCAIEYKIDGRVRKYYPDAAVQLASGDCFLVEVKPFFRLFLYQNILKISAALELCELNGCGFLLFTGRNISTEFDKIMIGSAHAMIYSLVSTERALGFREFKNVAKETTFRDLCAAIMHHNIRFDLAPFSVSRAHPQDEPHFGRFRNALGRYLSPPLHSQTMQDVDSSDLSVVFRAKQDTPPSGNSLS